MCMKRHASWKRGVVSGEEGEGGKAAAAAQEPQVVALARGCHWRDLIESRRYGGVSQLAGALREFVDRAFEAVLGSGPAQAVARSARGTRGA